MSKNYIIGTRGSLLAVTQCTLIQQEMEKKSQAIFELNKIKTQGDQITDKPLWQLEGKDFFTKELDEALLAQEIDLVVHSYKDLGTERPNHIKLGCITKRKFAHDILLIKKDKIKDLPHKTHFIVGTSSPRRIFNLQHNLSRYLPDSSTKVECKMLRGNVNTRIEKLRADEFDAIVLAFAGLERLASYPESRAILENLLDGLTFMILPQKDFPSSASQGALAIEYNDQRKDKLHEVLQKVHHEKTAEEIKRERAAFKTYGGGCHLPIGIHVKSVNDFYIHLHHGENQGKRFKMQKLEGYDYALANLYNKKPYFVFSKYDFLTKKIPIHSNVPFDGNIFVTSSLCHHNLKTHTTLWAAGNRSMKKLIQEGYWVNGSAEGFGHEEITNFKNSRLVEIFSKSPDWYVLSHDNAQSTVGECIPCYRHEIKNSVEKKYKDQLMIADIIYWSSFIQYEAYTKQFPEIINKIHACGLGKTLTTFQEKNIAVIPCIDMNHLENIVRTKNEK